MALTLSYRSAHPVSPEQEDVIRRAAEAANAGQTWVLTFARDPRDGHLAGAVNPWPGPYEAHRLLDALCALSRECGVDWDITHDYATRPVGRIRSGECRADPEAQAEAVRNMGEKYRQRPGG